MRSRPCTASPAPAFQSFRIVLFLVVAAAAALAATSPARAAWQEGGVPLSPLPPDFNTTYSLRGLLPDAVGGAYVTWESVVWFPPADATTFTLAAQRVDLLGNRPAPWSANGSSLLSYVQSPYSTSGIYSAFPVGLVPDGAGGAVHALVSLSSAVEPHSNFNLHHIAPDAAIVGFPYYSSPDFAGGATVATVVDADGAGGVIQFAIGQTFAPPLVTPPPRPLYARRIAPDGTTLWGVDDVIPPGLANGGLSALSDGQLGGWFAWVDSREAGDPDVYVTRIDDTGLPAPGFVDGGQLVCGAAGPQFDTHLVPDGAGGVYVIWRDQRDGTDRLYGSHVLPAGGAAPGIPADGQQIPSPDGATAFVNLAFDGGVGCYLVSAGGISRLHHLGPALDALPGWPAGGIALNTLPPGYGAVGLAADDAGGAYVSYRNGFGTAHPEGLYAQHFAANGSFAPGWTAGGVRLSGTGGASMLVRSGAGAIVAWDDFRSSYRGIYAQRLVTDGPVAVEMALVESSAGDGRILLHWYSAEGAGLAVAVERRSESSGWSVLAEEVADGGGHVRYEDGAAEPGERYGYRLTWREAGTARSTAETWLALPEIPAFRLETPVPNPSSGSVTVTFALSRALPARLEILDLAGRRLASRDLAAATGVRTARIPEAESLPPGLYVIQLRQADEVRHARLLRVR